MYKFHIKPHGLYVKGTLHPKINRELTIQDVDYTLSLH